jgi:DNA-binding response OmpR family regulator
MNSNPSPTPTGPRLRPRALIVDDEASVREVLTLFFQEEGYDVGQAADGDIALELFRQAHGMITLIFTDGGGRG